MSARILKFDASLPNVIFWDANFVINSCVTEAKYFSECSNLLRKIAKRKITSVISTLILEESWYGLLRIKLIKEYQDKWLDKLRMVLLD
ncbi:MAG: hypothetical protein AB1422_06435 [bacterium]